MVRTDLIYLSEEERMNLLVKSLSAINEIEGISPCFKNLMLESLLENEEFKPESRTKRVAKQIGMVALLGLIPGLIAFSMYRAAKTGYYKCKKSCSDSQHEDTKQCILNCRIDFLKASIAALEKAKSELKQKGKLTKLRELRINQKIKYYKEMIGNLMHYGKA